MTNPFEVAMFFVRCLVVAAALMAYALLFYAVGYMSNDNKTECGPCHCKPVCPCPCGCEKDVDRVGGGK